MGRAVNILWHFWPATHCHWASCHGVSYGVSWLVTESILQPPELPAEMLHSTVSFCGHVLFQFPSSVLPKHNAYNSNVLLRLGNDHIHWENHMIRPLIFLLMLSVEFGQYWYWLRQLVIFEYMSRIECVSTLLKLLSCECDRAVLILVISQRWFR